jgi:hypothetical protein
MADPTNITGMLIGGGLALSGTIVNQYFGLFSGAVERRHQTKLRNKQRLEKMVDLTTESLAWFSNLLACRTVGDYHKAQPPPQIRQLVMLARLSFPSIVGPAKSFAGGCFDYYSFVGECFNPKIDANMGAQVILAIKLNPELRGREVKVEHLRNVLDDAIAAEAKNYLDV